MRDAITGISAFQVPTVIIIVMIMVFEFMRYKKEGRIWHTISIIAWMLHGLLFYSVIALYIHNVIEVENSTLLFTNWSSGLRFHGYLTFFTLKLGKVLQWRLERK